MKTVQPVTISYLPGKPPAFQSRRVIRFGHETPVPTDVPREDMAIITRYTNTLRVSEEVLRLLDFHLALTTPSDPAFKSQRRWAIKELTALFAERYAQFREEAGEPDSVKAIWKFKLTGKFPNNVPKPDFPTQMTLETLAAIHCNEPGYLDDILKTKVDCANDECFKITRERLRTELAQRLPYVNTETALEVIDVAGRKGINRVKREIILKSMPKLLAFVALPSFAIQQLIDLIF